MLRNTFARISLAFLIAGALALAGCGGDDNGGLSASDMTRLDSAEMAAADAEARAEAAEMAAMDAEDRADAAEMAAADAGSGQADLEGQIADLEGRVDQEGFPSTDPQDPMTGPQVDIGVEHVSGLTEMAGDDFITNSPIKSRITPSHYLSESYDTERRHHDVALINGTAAVGFGGRQYLDDAETYGGWMEFNHFGVFKGNDDDGTKFTDVWSIGARSGSNPAGTELEWTGAFVGEEKVAATNMNSRVRGMAMIHVMLGDPLADVAAQQIDRARLTIGEGVNIDNNRAATALPYAGDNWVRTGGMVNTMNNGYTILMTDGLLKHGSVMEMESSANAGVAWAAIDDNPDFTIEGSFYGAAQQEVGGRFTMTREGNVPFDLIGAFGADRRGN